MTDISTLIRNVRKDCYKEGKKAFKNGKSLLDCPHHMEWDAWSWCTGWFDALANKVRN